MQFTCEQSVEAAAIKYNKLAVIASISVLISLLMIIAIYYLKTKSDIDNIKYDLETITISDYTVKLDITDEIYQNFLDDPTQQDIITN